MLEVVTGIRRTRKSCGRIPATTPSQESETWVSNVQQSSLYHPNPPTVSSHDVSSPAPFIFPVDERCYRPIWKMRLQWGLYRRHRLLQRPNCGEDCKTSITFSLHIHFSKCLFSFYLFHLFYLHFILSIIIFSNYVIHTCKSSPFNSIKSTLFKNRVTFSLSNIFIIHFPCSFYSNTHKDQYWVEATHECIWHPSITIHQSDLH